MCNRIREQLLHNPISTYRDVGHMFLDFQSVLKWCKSLSPYIHVWKSCQHPLYMLDWRISCDDEKSLSVVGVVTKMRGGSMSISQQKQQELLQRTHVVSVVVCSLRNWSQGGGGHGECAFRVLDFAFKQYLYSSLVYECECESESESVRWLSYFCWNHSRVWEFVSHV